LQGGFILSIYTKKGDRGTTSNVLGNIYSKADIMIELQGGVDEINANVGLLRSKLWNDVPNVQELQKIDVFLKKIQYNLFLLGVEISMEFTKSKVRLAEVEVMEQEIDYMTNRMNPLKNFIYQSGSEAAAQAHVVRSITRRVERVFVRTLEGREFPESYKYLNRVSDYFFTLARFLNNLASNPEEILILNE
jgi:cob(I)alamin adenosyltransferase